MIPGEYFIQRSDTVAIKPRIDLGISKCLVPGFVIILFLPGIKPGTVLPGIEDYID